MQPAAAAGGTAPAHAAAAVAAAAVTVAPTAAHIGPCVVVACSEFANAITTLAPAAVAHDASTHAAHGGVPPLHRVPI